MPDLPKKLELFALGDVCLDDGFKSFCKFLMVFLYEPLGVIVGVAIEEGTISVGDISI